MSYLWISSHGCHLTCPVRPMGFHQGDETNSNLPSQYIDDILLMGDSPHKVKEHLEALMFLLTNLGFIINIPWTAPTQIIKFLWLLLNLTSLLARRKAPSIKDGGPTSATEGRDYSSPVRTDYRKAQRSFPCSVTCTPILSFSRETCRGYCATTIRSTILSCLYQEELS